MCKDTYKKIGINRVEICQDINKSRSGKMMIKQIMGKFKTFKFILYLKVNRIEKILYLYKHSIKSCAN